MIWSKPCERNRWRLNDKIVILFLCKHSVINTKKKIRSKRKRKQQMQQQLRLSTNDKFHTNAMWILMGLCCLCGNVWLKFNQRPSVIVCLKAYRDLSKTMTNIDQVKFQTIWFIRLKLDSTTSLAGENGLNCDFRGIFLSKKNQVFQSVSIRKRRCASLLTAIQHFPFSLPIETFDKSIAFLETPFSIFFF